MWILCIYPTNFMNNSKRIVGSRLTTTHIPSEQMNKSKNIHYQAFGPREPVPERMSASIESKRKTEIIQKIENLFPFLQDIMGQNDVRSNTIIERLLGLRDNLDGIFLEIEDELEKTESENEGLKAELRRVQETRSHAANEELLEHRRNAEREIQRLAQETESLRLREDQWKREVETLKRENEQAFRLLDDMKKSSEELLTKNRDLASRGVD